MVTQRHFIRQRPSFLVSLLNKQSGGRSFVFMYLTNQCQLNCAHCSFQSGTDQLNTHVDGQLLLDLLDELKGIRDITLSGGEPMLHPDFDAVLFKAAERAGIVYLMTNGINLIGKGQLGQLAKGEKVHELVSRLKTALARYPENSHIFFPLDSFHVKAFPPFGFLMRGLARVAAEWNHLAKKPYLGFLSNEISLAKSQELMHRFSVKEYTHVGTARFAPWRTAGNVEEWYTIHPLNRVPFAGGIYINYKGVYRNEASLLMDLREGIATNLKLGDLLSSTGKKNQLEMLYKQIK
jgi:hypothetical protein